MAGSDYCRPISDEDQRLLETFHAMPHAWRPAFIRLGIRLLNNDPKAQRLMEMRDRGQISQAQLFSMM